MIRYCLILAALILTFSGCDKVNDDLAGDGVLSGRLFYSDFLQPGFVAVPLPGKKICIAYSPSDTMNYIYSVPTDSAGYFNFVNLNADKTYDIFFEDSIGGKRAFAFSPSQKPTQKTLSIVAHADTIQQSILVITILDNHNTPIAGAGICMFNSQAAFMADSCTGSIASVATDANGRAQFYNLQRGTYYLRIKYSSPGIFLYAESQVKVDAARFTSQAIPLSQVTNLNSLDILVATPDNAPVPKCPVYVFNNKTLFLADTSAGSIAQVTTDFNGKASVNNLAAGTYYFLVKDSIGKLAIHGTGSIDMAASDKKSITIFVSMQ